MRSFSASTKSIFGLDLKVRTFSGDFWSKARPIQKLLIILAAATFFVMGSLSILSLILNLTTDARDFKISLFLMHITGVNNGIETNLDVIGSGTNFPPCWLFTGATGVAALVGLFTFILLPFFAALAAHSVSAAAWLLMTLTIPPVVSLLFIEVGQRDILTMIVYGLISCIPPVLLLYIEMFGFHDRGFKTSAKDWVRALWRWVVPLIFIGGSVCLMYADIVLRFIVANSNTPEGTTIPVRVWITGISILILYVSILGLFVAQRLVETRLDNFERKAPRIGRAFCAAQIIVAMIFIILPYVSWYTSIVDSM